MPREEHDREDLLAEATALVERIQLQAAGLSDELTVGFRRDHSASFYFGPDRVYQFTSDGQLRRAMVGELLFKAEQGRLVALRRERDTNQVSLVRHVLGETEAMAFLDSMTADLEMLHHALAKQHFSVRGQVPADIDLVARVCCWLDEFAGRRSIAASPRVA